MRTSINVLGDAYGAGIIYHLCRAELEAGSAERQHIEIQERSSNIGQTNSLIGIQNTFHKTPKQKKGLKCCNTDSINLQEDDSSETQM